MDFLPTTILVVDDNGDVRDVVAKMLGPECTVHLASDGRQAIRIFRKHYSEIDCVVLDVVMPEFCGVQTFHELRKMNGEIPVLFMSGYCQQSDMHKTLQADHCDIIFKPFIRKDLLAQLAQLVPQTTA